MSMGMNGIVCGLATDMLEVTHRLSSGFVTMPFVMVRNRDGRGKAIVTVANM